MVYRNLKSNDQDKKFVVVTKSMLKIALKLLQSLRKKLVHMQEHQIPLKSLAGFGYKISTALFWASRNSFLKVVPKIKRRQILDISRPTLLILKPKVQIWHDHSWL